MDSEQIIVCILSEQLSVSKGLNYEILEHVYIALDTLY